MRLYVRNLPYSTTEADLLQLFDDWAGKDAYLATNADGRPIGIGFIEVEEVVADIAVDALHGREYRGRRIYVRIARKQRKRFDQREKAVSVAALTRETR